MASLPQPVTVTDHYLAAIHGVLGEIRDRLPAQDGPLRADVAGRTTPGEPVELREPAPLPAAPETEPAPPRRPARKPAQRKTTRTPSKGS
ncbi:hypothetical protein ACFHW2_11865 [Actinomadura sp. LOL_016]|uniref:hypothetical protein n=1 Tax=unclassified Actinomadura TaxID=2626254 RepID=UPI003A80137B